MSDFPLLLGDVEFQDFEIPQKITAGGAQGLNTHKYSNGLRTVDAFGPDDDAITWSGIFFDGDAEARCQQIDTMRRQGAPVTLSWSSFNYLVIVKTFTFDSEKFYQIPYSISLEVVQDNTQPSSDAGDDPESDIQGDVTDAGTFSASIGDVDLTAAVSTVQTDVASVDSVTGGSIDFLATLGNDIGSAVLVAGSVSDAADNGIAELGDAALYAAGVDGGTIADNLSALSVQAELQPQAFSITNTLTRLGKNVVAVTE